MLFRFAMSDRKDQVSRQKNKPEKNRNCQIFFRIGNFSHLGFFDVAINQESVASSVIQATGTAEFDDGLRMGVFLGGCWYHFSDNI